MTVMMQRAMLPHMTTSPYATRSYLAMEARVLASRQRVREQRCAEGVGHVQTDSATCDACGWRPK